MKHAFSKIQDTDNMRMDETNQGYFLTRITYHKWERRGYKVWETWQEAPLTCRPKDCPVMPRNLVMLSAAKYLGATRAGDRKGPCSTPLHTRPYKDDKVKSYDVSW
jgi:hypothetical protein